MKAIVFSVGRAGSAVGPSPVVWVCVCPCRPAYQPSPAAAIAAAIAPATTRHRTAISVTLQIAMRLSRRWSDALLDAGRSGVRMHRMPTMRIRRIALISRIVALQQILRATAASRCTLVRQSEKIDRGWPICGCAIATNPISKICNVSDSGRNANALSYLDRCAAASVGALPSPARRRPTDLEVTHWWTSGGEAAAVAEFAKAFDATGNKWVDGAIAGSRRHRASDHDQPHHRRRPDGRHPVQPRPSGRGTGRGRPDARPTDVADQGELDGGHPPASLLDGCTHRRQDLLRAGQHPLLAVAVAVEQGLRGGRRAGADELGRVRRRRARRSRRPASSRSPSAASPGRRPAPSTC